ncbi:MAG: RluA family pseudouridine synthase [Clostridiales bacterium]|jgi:23S rRNA pseudouridine1911/1915/1917 synthase|nr:RluA family pseudouridine synthase [Clostridiales bacterium]
MYDSKSYVFKIESKDSNSRIDSVLANLIEDTSRSSIQKLIEEVGVKVNGQIIKSKKYKLKEGDIVELIIEQAAPLAVLPENIPIEIVYEDDDILIVNKAKGMVVHPAAGNSSGTLVNALIYHRGDALSSINGEIRRGIVHRIDKDTSGLLLVAKNDDSHRSLAEQLAAHTVKRAYRAIVYDNIIEDSGTIDQPIGRDPSNRLRMAVTQTNSKEAVTHFHVLERFKKFTYIEARLLTGRTHQIRVHMAYIKHPLLGDNLYGPKKSFMGIKGQMLHAKTLGFNHPRTGEYLEFDSELPRDFQELLNQLNKRFITA